MSFVIAVRAKAAVGGHPARGALFCSMQTVDTHKLDPTLHDDVEGAPEIDFFRDFAYPANKMRWKKNTKQVGR